MAKYRYTDRQETTAHGQVLGYAEWMWGPSLTYVAGAILEDGTRANWFKTGLEEKPTKPEISKWRGFQATG